MTFPKLLLIVALVLFGSIGVVALIKKGSPSSRTVAVPVAKPTAPIEVALPVSKESKPEPVKAAVAAAPTKSVPPQMAPVSAATEVVLGPEPVSADGLPNEDRIEQLFRPGTNALPIVETITYSSRVSWMSDRPAWIADYASHYDTSRHFIARSLNRGPDYFTQNISNGDRFNVFREGKNLSFYLLVDASRCKMWFYYIDGDTNQRTLLKRYDVVLGRLDGNKQSGSLTPLGKYSLGSKVAIYRPTVTGIYDGAKIEMIRVFGTRWIPFDQELAGCTEPAKGLGIHGAPWAADAAGQLKEQTTVATKYESDGCIRLATNDIEELFAIIITKPTVIEIVRDFYDAEPPGVEQES